MLIRKDNIDFEDLSSKILGGINKALHKLVEKSAANDESLVVGDDNGGFKIVPAKDLLEQMMANAPEKPL